jgi:hypothetical protein
MTILTWSDAEITFPVHAIIRQRHQRCWRGNNRHVQQHVLCRQVGYRDSGTPGNNVTYWFNAASV